MRGLQQDLPSAACGQPLTAWSLLSSSQGKVDACSAYDPVDLFSGEPGRVRSALAALLAQPQNNLQLFVDGQRRELEGQQRQRARRRRGQQQHELLQQLPAIEAQLGELLPVAAGQRSTALASLLAAVLEREGVLARLLEAQRQCLHDVEGMHRLYCHLTGAPLPAAAAAESAAAAEDASGSDASASASVSSSASSAAALASHAEAVARLLALPADEAHAALRGYVVAATAKDCALMVTLQRLSGPPVDEGGTVAAAAGEQQQQRPADEQGWAAAAPPAFICCPGASSSSSSSGFLAAGAPGEAPAPAGGGGGGSPWYRYRLCFVDLDQKPLSKIPAHADLDRRIVEAAKRHSSGRGGGGRGGHAAAAAGGGAAAGGAVNG